MAGRVASAEGGNGESGVGGVEEYGARDPRAAVAGVQSAGGEDDSHGCTWCVVTRYLIN